MKRVLGVVAIVACASCGKLLGHDEDPAAPEKAPEAVNDGGDAESADSAPSDAAGQSDGAFSCKPVQTACAAAAECCAGMSCIGTCCIVPNQPAKAAIECCVNKKTLVLCDPPLTGMCCSDSV